MHREARNLVDTNLPWPPEAMQLGGVHASMPGLLTATLRNVRLSPFQLSSSAASLDCMTSTSSNSVVPWQLCDLCLNFMSERSSSSCPSAVFLRSLF